MPSELMFIVLVGRERLRSKNLLGLLLLQLSYVSLFFCRILALVLQVETNWELEVALDSTALVRSLKCVKHLDVNFWPVEGSIAGVDSPGLSELV